MLVVGGSDKLELVGQSAGNRPIRRHGSAQYEIDEVPSSPACCSREPLCCTTENGL